MADTTQAHCNSCGGNRNHDIISEIDRGYEDDSYDLGYCEYKYELLECRGCSGITLRHTYGYEDSRKVIYYPPAISRRTPNWADEIFELFADAQVSDQVTKLMREVYTAVQNGLRRIAAMGIRAALEMTMVDKIGDQGTFKSNLDTFHKAGYLSTRQYQILDSVLDASHATTHRGWEPVDQDINTLLEIAESTIESAYLHEVLVRKLSDKVPKRARPSTKS